MKIFIIFLLVFTTAITVSAGVDLKTDHPADVYYLKSDKKVKIQNKKIEIDEVNEPLWVSSKGRVPFLLVPVDSDTREINISSPKLEQQAQKNTTEELDRRLSTVMLEVLAIQKKLSRGRTAEARVSLDALMKQYPDLTFLNFLAATISTLEGNKPRAIEFLKKGLLSHPDYADGKSLLRKLQGGQ